MNSMSNPHSQINVPLRCPESIQALVTGDFWKAEFQHLFVNETFRFSYHPWEALHELTSDQFPQTELVLLSQSRRGQFCQSRVYQLKQQFPLTPLVIVLGAWCEGETRSGSPLDGAHRVYWHKLPSFLGEFCRQLGQTGISDWHQPPTKAQIGSMATCADPISAHVPVGHTTHVLVHTPSRAMFQAIDDVCRVNGWNSAWHDLVSKPAQSAGKPDVIVVDAVFGLGQAEDQIHAAQKIDPELPIILLSGFPRHHEWWPLIRRSNFSVVSKPFSNYELAQAIHSARPVTSALASP